MPGRLSEAEGGDEGFLAENGTSPDAAAQAAHDAGRLAESTVDAFWDAVRGDVSAVTQWKEREKARVDAETAHAARWGAERFRKDLAALADRDAQGRLAIGGGYLDDWSVRAQDAFNRGLRTEAQIAEGLGIPYGAWMTHHPLGGRGEDTITGVVGEDGRDIRASDLLDLSHEWHHVGRRFDEALFLDPNDFPDVRTPADIDDKQTAALFFYYTRMREAPREVNRASLTAEERDALTQRERPVWEAFARTVAPARDAFVRAIAAEAEPDTLRPLAEAYANAMRAHKRLADDATKQFLASIGKPRAYLNERPHRAGSVRYAVGGDAPRTPIAIPNEYMTAREAKAILDAQRGKVFVNQDDGREATINGTQVRKLLSNRATDKSVANGFSITQHNQAVAHVGELYENATPAEERPDKSGDPNIVAIRRYASPITVSRNGQSTPATAWLTIKESEQNGNRIYSLELLELGEASVSATPRDEGLPNNQHPRARTPLNTVAYPGADVNPRLSVGGLYSGASVAYDRPSLRAVGSNHRGTAMGWGLYTDTRFVVASAYATGPAAAIHEQRWWTNRPEGDESHLLDWDKPLSPENHARVLSAIDALDLDPRDLEATFGKGWRTEERTGGQAYELVADVFRHLVDEDTLDAFGSDLQAASEHLAAFDIDGIVSHHSDASATYVAFSDEHLQVVRRWVWDPQTQDFALDTTFLPPTPAPRRSIGGWLDQATEAHLAAEREGDVETAQRLVYEAADRSEYRYKAAHGTGHFGFTVFDPNKSDDKRSLFFAGDPTLAATYQWQATDISGYGSANTAFRDVASTIRPLELDLNAEYPNDAAFIHAVTEAVERAGGTVAVGHLEPGSGGTVEVAPHEHITLKPWPQDYILVTMPRSDGPKAFDILTPDTMVREAKALNAAREEELRGYAARLKAEYEADPNGEYFGAFERMSKKDRWLQAEHTLQTFLKNPQPYLEDERLTAAQSAAMATIRMNWEFYRRNDSFGIYHVALRMDNPLVIDAQGGNWSAIDIKLPGSNRKHWKTRQLAEYAQTHGYDGVQINNVYDLGPNYIPGAGRKPSSVYIVFDGNQVKSLDPFTYDDSGNLIPLSERFDTAQPDIRLSVGGENPQATPARQKKAHGAYPDLGDAIASARFSVGAKRKQEYRALIVKTRPNLPQEDVDTFMQELDTLNDTKAEKAALHWFVKGALILPEDREKLDMAVRMSGKWHLDFQAFDTPAALINEANARAEAKKKKPALAYLDPDTVPQLTNKRDLGHGVVVYDVEDSEAGQQAMRQIMNSHLGRNADGEFWSPWCLLTCSPKTGALSESARNYWEHYNKTGRAAAFHNGKLCAFQSSDTKRRKWWDLDDKDHGTKIPLPLTITAKEMGYASGDIPGDIVIQNAYEMTQDGKLVPLAKPKGRAFLVGTRGSIAEGKTERWIFAQRRVFKAETSLYKNGVRYKSVETRYPAYEIIRFYAEGNQAEAHPSYPGSPYYDRTIKDSNGLTLREDRRLTEEEANQNPFDNPNWRSDMMTPRTGDRRTEYNGGTDWTYEEFENGKRIFYAEYRDVNGRGRPHGRTEYIDEDTGALVTEYYDHGEQVDHPVVNERIVPGQGTPRFSVGGSARYARADFVARATPIANDPSVKERSAHYVPIGDVPDALVRHGATPGGLITTDGKVAKMARRHDLPPERLADAIEAMNDPVAIFLEWEDAARGNIGLSVLTDVLADDGEGRQAPVRLTLITRTDAPGMFLTSAYARKRSKEHNYVKVVANGGLLYVDAQRVAQLPLEDATVSACVPSNVRGDPSTGTVPNREEEVKENVRRAIGGVERARRVGAAAALYYGRSPAVADVATAAIVELALLAEADRSGKRYSTQDIKDAYADFGIHADDLWSEAWRLARCGSAADRPRISG